MASRILVTITREEKEWARELSEFKYEVDTQSRILNAERSGYQKGFLERMLDVETAWKLKDAGVAVGVIVSATGFLPGGRAAFEEERATASQILAMISKDEDERRRFLSGLECDGDTRSKIRQVIRYGLERGCRQGRLEELQECLWERKVEIARSLEAAGISADTIVSATGLSLKNPREI
jgi:hypothetical protein